MALWKMSCHTQGREPQNVADGVRGVACLSKLASSSVQLTASMCNCQMRPTGAQIRSSWTP